MYGGGRYEDDEDRPQPSASGTYKVPDRDFYRKNFNTFSSIYTHFQDKLYVRRFEDRRLMQPHYSALANLQTPYGNVSNPADGVCCHFLRRGFTKPNKVQFNAAVWSPDARWLVLGTQNGDLALWEGEALKVHKVMSIPAHKEFFGDGIRVKEQFPITAMTWKRHGHILVSGDSRGLIQYCDEAFHNVVVTKEAHAGAVRGLSYSPLDSKLVSCGDDGRLHIWAGGRDKPESVLLGHQSDVKSVDWHPQRALIVSGSRDSSIKLWDPKQGKCISTINGHKKQVNCCLWNGNGNWLASGSMDGLIKLYDIRMMKEFEVWRGHNSEICSMAWHPIHESLMLSGGYNGSLIYWVAGQNQLPHTMIADAHRQSVDVIAWHPSGHLLGTASHDCILKFWCREPPGSKLEPAASELAQENPPTYLQGPIEPGTPSVISSRYTPGAGPFGGQNAAFGGQGGGPQMSGQRGNYHGPGGHGGGFGGGGGGGHGYGGSYGPGHGGGPGVVRRFSSCIIAKMRNDVLVLIGHIVTTASYFMLTFQLCQFATGAQIRELFATLINSKDPKKRNLFKMITAVAALFASFIALCGCTHGFSVLRHFFPESEAVITAETGMLIFCAAVSLFTAIASYRLFPIISAVLSKFELNAEGNLQLAENYLIEIVEMVKESILVISENFVVTRSNEASKVLFCSPNLLGATITDYIHAQDLQAFHDTVNRVLSSYSLTPVVVEYRVRQSTPVPGTPAAKQGSGNLSLPKRPSKIFSRASSNYKICASSDNLSSEDGIMTPAVVNQQYSASDSPTGSFAKSPVTGAGDYEFVWVESTICKGMRVNHTEDFEYDLKIVTRNIDDKKKEALNHVQSILRENEERGRINAAKLRYLSCIAHDLKTPLQSFCFTLDLLNQSNLQSDQREFIEQANVAVDLMKLTISQTMDISKALTGAKLMPRRTTVYLSSILSRVQVIINGYGKQVPIAFEVTADVNDAIITDEEWLWQMLLNLLTNACKYTDKGEIRVLLSHKPIAAGEGLSQNDMLMVEVYDTGVGISSDKIEHVFDAFAQVQDGQVTGTGLGLFGVRTRAEGLHGSCGARHNTESSTGTGTVMWFAIPYLPDLSSDFTFSCMSKDADDTFAVGPSLLRDIPATESKTADLSASPPPATLKSLKDLKLSSTASMAHRTEELIRRCKLTAMVIDDTLTVRKLMEKLLLRMGFDKVDCYENGSKGLDAMMAGTVDIVFSDVQMPIMTGPEMIHRFRKFEVEALQSGLRKQRQLVVAVTANGAEIGNNSDTGFDTVCPKPLGVADIFLLIDQYF